MLFDNSCGGHTVVTYTNHNPLCMTFRSTKFGSPSVPTLFDQREWREREGMGGQAQKSENPNNLVASTKLVGF